MMRISPARRAAIERMSLTLLVLISAVMIIIGKADQVAFQSLRNSLMDAAAPALDMLSRPAAALDAAAGRVRGFITVYRDNLRLAEENERLLGWQQVAMRLSAENAELRDLSKLVSEPAISFVTARVIADSGGAYARSVMVNAGRDNGVARPGSPHRGRPRSRCCLPERSYYPSGIILLTGPSRSSGPASPC
jgi:rod shape-determining protein MreC